MNKPYFKPLLASAGLMAAFFSSSAVMADSAKLLFAGNGHYYQYVDSTQTSWSSAIDICKGKGGYLATITSLEEQNFITTNLVTGSSWAWLGGNDMQQPGTFKWVTTNERFKYQNWDSGANRGGSYILLFGNGHWFQYPNDNSGNSPLCEWENNKAYISVLGLPDLNSNGSSESAALYLDTNYAHTVVIKDTNTQATLKTLVFDTKNATPPIAMAQVSDMNANGAPEIAVMYWTKPTKNGAITIGAMIGIMIKDASTGIASRTAPIGILSNQYKAISLTSTPDMTGDGISELEVLVMKYKDNSVSSQIIDPVAGTVVKTVNF